MKCLNKNCKSYNDKARKNCDDTMAYPGNCKGFVGEKTDEEIQCGKCGAWHSYNGFGVKKNCFCDSQKDL